jgi:disulfide bond formation protein DsbB
MTQTVTNSLSLLVLISNVAIAGAVILFLLYLSGVNKTYWERLLKYLKGRKLWFAFVISLTATLGSLFFSEIAGFEPCKLCWFQRIFMYPLPIILGVSLFKGKKDVEWYVKPLSVIGFLIAAYHYYIQINPQPLVPCSTVGFSVSCSTRFVTNFGYITIPFMSLTAFLMITFLMISKIYGKK